MRVSEPKRIVHGSAASTTTAARPPPVPPSRRPSRQHSQSATGTIATVSSRTVAVPVPKAAVHPCSSR